MLDEARSGIAGIADAEEAPQPRVCRDDAPVGRNDDRSDDGARFEGFEIEAGGRLLGVRPTRWLWHQTCSGNNVGIRPNVSVSKG